MFSDRIALTSANSVVKTPKNLHALRIIGFTIMNIPYITAIMVQTSTSKSRPLSELRCMGWW